MKIKIVPDQIYIKLERELGSKVMYCDKVIKLVGDNSIRVRGIISKVASSIKLLETATEIETTTEILIVPIMTIEEELNK